MQEYQRLHQRYVDLSGRFRAMWTYHQLLQGLHRLFPNDVDVGYDADFQRLYSRLKEMSQSLSDSNMEEVALAFDDIENELNRITKSLLEEDSRVGPSLLRRFFRHVKNYDDKVLTQLVKFLLVAEPEGAWEGDRLDKLDFLLTKLAREMASVHPGQLPITVDNLRSLTELPAPAAGAVEKARGEILAYGEEAVRLATFEELQRTDLIARYRKVKNELGSLFLEPPVLLAILDTNRTVGDRVEELYRQEERAIFAESQRLSDLGPQMAMEDEAFGGELAALESELERFEGSVRQGNVRLADVVTIRDRLSSLLPRVEEARGEERVAVAAPGGVSSGIDDSVESWTRPVASEAILRETLDELIAALEGANPGHDPRAVTLERELFGFRLEAREVSAYRRLSSGIPCDRDLEAFILKGAALRRRLNLQAEEITSLLDESSVTGDAPVFEEARQATDLADAYLRLFGHAQDRSIVSGDIEEARNLKILMMRLMRDYSGVWLLSRRPREKKTV